MTGELVDKGIDEEERDDRPARSRRRRRLLVGGSVAGVVIVGVALAATRPWADDNDAAPVSTAPDAGEPVAPALPNTLILRDVPDGYAIEWISDGVEDGFDGSADATNVLLVAPGATVADGRWLAVRVVALALAEQRDFDPQMYTHGEGQPVPIGEWQGAYVEESFDGSSQVVMGPVNDRFLVSISAEGFDRDQLIGLAAEMQLDEIDGGTAAWPAFSDRAAGMEPLASYVQPGETFADSSLYSFLGATSSSSTSVSYTTGDGHGIELINDAVTPGLDTLEVARFALVDAVDVTVHGMPAVMGSMEGAFGGSMVLWEEGGRSVVVFASDDLDLLDLAESVDVADGAEWEALQAEADGLDDNGNGNGNGNGEPQWLIGVGELDDGATWLVEGSFDPAGGLTLCVSVTSANTSMAGCSGSGEMVDGPAILNAGELGSEFGFVIVAAVPAADAGAVFRFTDPNGNASEVALDDKTPNLPFHAAAIAVTQPGTAEIMSADGRVLATDDISEDDLGRPSD